MTDAFVHYSDPPSPGYVCERCGLSDVGFDRFVANGFDPHPCRYCRDHFADRSDQ